MSFKPDPDRGLTATPEAMMRLHAHLDEVIAEATDNGDVALAEAANLAEVLLVCRSCYGDTVTSMDFTCDDCAGKGLTAQS